MFGNKLGKQQRLTRLVFLIQRGEALSQAELARNLGIARSTVLRDLVTLEDHGILLTEDDEGRLRYFGRSKNVQSR